MPANGTSRSELPPSAMLLFGPALRHCREQRGFTLRDVAENVNVSIATVEGWERPRGLVPPSQKLARLIGMMPALRHFKHLIRKHQQRAADVAEAAAEKKAAAAERKKDAPPPPPPPEPAPPPPAPPPPEPAPKVREGRGVPGEREKVFGAALLAARESRGLSLEQSADLVGLSRSTLRNVEMGGQTIGPFAYASFVRGFPELKEVPAPTLRGPNGNIYAPEALPPMLDPGPAPVAAPPATTLEALGALYAKALQRQRAATRKHEDALLVAMVAEDERRAAEAAAADVLARLTEAADRPDEAGQ